MLKVNSLHIQNFRCFADVALELHPRLTVIVADNGMGKTAVLDALAIGLAEFVDVVTTARQASGIQASDVRIPNSDDYRGARAEITLEADIRGDATQWSLSRGVSAVRMGRSSRRLGRMLDAAASMRREWAISSTILPVVVHYGSTRFARGSYFDEAPRKRGKKLVSRLHGYSGFLNPLSDGAHFNRWYAERVDAVRSRVLTGSRYGGDALAELSAVRNAVKTVLEPTGWTEIDWDEERGCVVVEHSERGRLPLSRLSSGIRSMVALTADLAHRCASLNPEFGMDAPASTPGVVLIDEVDLHLHPSWQQKVIDLLQEAFADAQFIVTTHSPQVLSTVHKESVRVIHHDESESRIALPPFQTRGVESADILAKVMSVDPIPRVREAGWLSDYREFIQDGRHQSSDAETLWSTLVEHFGVHHPVLDELSVLRRLQDFMEAEGLNGGGDD